MGRPCKPQASFLENQPQSVLLSRKLAGENHMEGGAVRGPDLNELLSAAESDGGGKEGLSRPRSRRLRGPLVECTKAENAVFGPE